jgi:nitrogen fixation/metabolism regulation signal transduction histidine kinase
MCATAVAAAESSPAVPLLLRMPLRRRACRLDPGSDSVFNRHMAVAGRIRGRLALAIVLTALIPVLVAVLLAQSMVQHTAARFFVPEIGSHLDQSLGVYQELARAVKMSMRSAATAVAADEALRKAAQQRDSAAIRQELQRLFPKYPGLVSLTVKQAEGEPLARVDRGYPLDRSKENDLVVVRPLAGDAKRGSPEANAGATGRAATEEGEQAVPAAVRLVAVFAAAQARFEQRDKLSQFLDTYRRIERRRKADEASYVYAFAALLGLTIVAAVGVGALLARGVSARISELAEVTKLVGAGDLTIRAPERGSDEIADLARAFNRMLGEVEAGRARVEYLQRIGAWQEMARRLAHEIKNPLTPIQLAVQEIHRRYRGDDAHYRELVNSTLEVVEDEVATLRRLVGEFSDFARVPRAQLKEADLAALLQDQRERLAMPDEGLTEAGERDDEPRAQVQVRLDLQHAPAPAYVDRQMLRRALINLARNAAQAACAAEVQAVQVCLRLIREGDYWTVDVDDNGPGIPPPLRTTVFDPYITTRTEGTGLGLAIVKKIVVEHGGSIAALQSPLGGARIRIRLPVAGTPDGVAALESSAWEGSSSTGRRQAAG